jgi:hypothetical protein
MTNTYIALATVTLASSTTSITFSSIPATYRDLVLIGYSLSGTGVRGFGTLRFNGNTSDYSRTEMVGNGTSAVGFAAANLIPITYGTVRAAQIIHIMDYAQTDRHKGVLYRNSLANDGALLGSGRWGNTAAINNVSLISFSENFGEGSTFSLYGVN